MQTPAVIVKTAAREVTPANAQLSGFLLSSYKVIHKVHRIWSWSRRVETYSNPDNFLKLAAGRVLNWFAGDKLPIRVAAHAVLITKHILETVDEQVALTEEARGLWAKMIDPYALAPKVKWGKCRGFTLLSPSSKNWWRAKFSAIAAKIMRIFRAIVSIFKRLFGLSMKMLDTVAAFSFKTSTRHAAVNELFVNFSKMMQLMSDEREVLLCCLENNKAVIKQLLEGTQSVFTYEQLVQAVQKTIKVSQTLKRETKGASKMLKVISRDIFQRASFGLFQMVGMTHLLPDSWVPPKEIPWLPENEEVKCYERFPSKIRIQLGGEKALNALKAVEEGKGKIPSVEEVDEEIESRYIEGDKPNTQWRKQGWIYDRQSLFLNQLQSIRDKALFH